MYLNSSSMSCVWWYDQWQVVCTRGLLSMHLWYGLLPGSSSSCLSHSRIVLTTCLPVCSNDGEWCDQLHLFSARPQPRVLERGLGTRLSLAFLCIRITTWCPTSWGDASLINFSKGNNQFYIPVPLHAYKQLLSIIYIFRYPKSLASKGVYCWKI